MMKKNKYQTIPVILLLAMICDLLWGSAFPCIKLGYEMFKIESGDTATQLLFAGYRFSVAGVMVILFNCIKEHRLVYPRSIKSVKRAVTLSMFQTVLQYLFFYIGLAHTTGVKGAVIEASNVFMCIFITCALVKYEKITSQKIIGSIIGFAGVVIINIQGLSLDVNRGDLFILISTCAYSISSILLKKYAADDNTVMLSGYQFLFGGIILTVIGITMGGRISNITTQGVAMLLYLAFISAMAYSLWAVLLAHNPISKIAVLGFMNPVFGVILSGILLEEGASAFSVRSAVALIFVSVGIFIVYRKRK